MRLPGAYRSLPRPSSALEPSYPLNGIHGLLLLDTSSAQTYRKEFALFAYCKLLLTVHNITWDEHPAIFAPPAARNRNRLLSSP